MAELVNFSKPVLGFAAYSGTGKTTLLVKLLPILRERGLRVAMIKHAHHDFDIDTPGKDSYELRKAGAEQMLIASSYRQALIIEAPGADEPQLSDMIDSLNLDEIDLVLVEGFRHLAFEKIELHRPSLGKETIFSEDENIIAVAADEQIECPWLPRIDINKPEMLADFIEDWLKEKMENK